MEDTVKIWLALDNWGGGTYVRNYLPNYLTKLRTGRCDKYGYYTRGFIDTMYVSANENHLTLSGSLPKFTSGCNIHPCTFEEKEWLFEHLEERLHLPLGNGLIRRLDISSSFCMSRTPTHYFDFMVEYPKAKRLLMDSSLEFRVGQRQVAFYDKALREKKEGLNLMRYELRLLKGKTNTKSLPSTLSVQDLLKPNVHNRLIKLWQDESLKIQYKPNFTGMFNSQTVDSLKTFKDELILIGLQKMGEVQALQKVENLKKEGVFPNPETPSRIKRFIREEMNKSIGLDGLPIEVVELKSKIQETVEEYSV